MLAERTVVGTLRAHCAGIDATSAQLRLGAQLGSASLRPRGLPPSALLCVRSLRDPLPGTIRLDGLQLGPPAEWARAAEEALDEALRGAARPALGPVPAGAEAVLFADRAELLACLARDALDGTAWTRWWWATVMRNAPSGVEPVAAAWLAQAAYVPAAFGHLARTGQAAVFARTLRTADALELAVRVARAFAARALVRALAEAATGAAPSEPTREAAPQKSAGGPARPAAPEAAPAETWRAIVPEAEAPGLSVEQEIVLAVSLLLRRAPAQAREPLVARAVARAIRTGTSRPEPVEPEPPPEAWQQAPEHAHGAESAHPSRSGPAAEATKDETRRAAAPKPAVPRRPPAATVERASASETTPLSAEPTTLAEPGTPPAAARSTKPEVAPKHSPPPATSTTRKQARRAPSLAASSPLQPVSHPAKRAAKPEPNGSPDLPPPDERPFPGVGVETELGGLFFLLNVGLFLGLYGDFTTPDEPGIELDPWDFVALLGTRLLGGDISAADEVWPLLARLAGRRPGERPGRRFEPDADWRVPAHWLEAFDGEGEWLWSTARGTLRIVHPAGFPVVAVALRGRDGSVLLPRELRRYRLSPPLRRASLPPESRVLLRRWAARLAAYMAARLQGALGDPDRRHAVETVLRRQATVFATETHVDVAMSLSALPIEIRLAGLDRDPGWIPAARRFVAFHFG